MKGILQSRAKRILLVSAAILVSVVLASPWVVPLLLDLEGARKDIAAEMSQKLRRQVRIGSLSVGFFSASIRDVVISDREGFADEPLITIAKASASVHPFALLRGRLAIAHVKARRPVLVIKRTAEGDVNVADLLRGHASSDDSPSAGKPKKRWRPFHTVDVEKVTLSRATVKFVDAAAGRTTELSGVDAYCQGDLSSDPIKVATARIGFQGLWIRIAGEMSRDRKHGWLQLHVDDVDLMTYKEYIPFLSGFETGRWRIQDTALDAKIADGVVEIADFSCRPSGGTFSATGKLWFERDKPCFTLEAKAEEVQLDPFLWQTRTDKISFGGAASGTCSLSSQGATPEEVKSGLQGSAEVIVTDGRYQNKVFIKIGETVKKALRIRIPEEYRASEARGHFQIGDGKIKSSDLRFDSKNLFDVRMTGPGYVTFDGNLYVPKAVVSARGEDPLEVPIKIRGTVNRPRVDFEWKSLRKKLIGE